MPPTTRRDFVRDLGLAAAASLLVPARASAARLERLIADPYAPLARRAMPGTPVRVTGTVSAAGRPIAGAAVTDGLTVTTTGADGRYVLRSDATRRWVSLSLPRAYDVPRTATGTARLHRPLAADARGEMRAAFELERLPDGDDRHAFLLLADPQTENAREMARFHAETVPDARATLAALGGRHTFGVACGDIMFDDLTLYPEYERAVKAMGAPFFQVVGNHDLTFTQRTDDASTDVFERHFGPPYYSFDRGRVHYVVLDDVFWHGAGYIGYLPAEQLQWLERDLARVERGSPVIVLTHIPALGAAHVRRGQRSPAHSSAVTNREALFRLLEPYAAHVVVGHMHESEHLVHGRIHEHVAGAACGAWWSGDICHDGTPNGYAVYEIDGEDVRWRYKSTGLDATRQVRVYAHGADPAAPEEIVANVWDWDPAWRVAWYEDGARKGLMSRRTGLDPMSVELHAGPNKPPLRPWVEPAPTGHLFYAPASPAAQEIRVEATDRWGRTYSSVVPRV